MYTHTHTPTHAHTHIYTHARAHACTLSHSFFVLMQHCELFFCSLSLQSEYSTVTKLISLLLLSYRTATEQSQITGSAKTNETPHPSTLQKRCLQRVRSDRGTVGSPTSCSSTIFCLSTRTRSISASSCRRCSSILSCSSLKARKPHIYVSHTSTSTTQTPHLHQPHKPHIYINPTSTSTPQTPHLHQPHKPHIYVSPTCPTSTSTTQTSTTHAPHQHQPPMPQIYINHTNHINIKNTNPTWRSATQTFHQNHSQTHKPYIYLTITNTPHFTFTSTVQYLVLNHHEKHWFLLLLLLLFFHFACVIPTAVRHLSTSQSGTYRTFTGLVSSHTVTHTVTHNATPGDIYLPVDGWQGGGASCGGCWAQSSLHSSDLLRFALQHLLLVLAADLQVLHPLNLLLHVTLKASTAPSSDTALTGALVMWHCWS